MCNEPNHSVYPIYAKPRAMNLHYTDFICLCFPLSLSRSEAIKKSITGLLCYYYVVLASRHNYSDERIQLVSLSTYFNSWKIYITFSTSETWYWFDILYYYEKTVNVSVRLTTKRKMDQWNSPTTVRQRILITLAWLLLRDLYNHFNLLPYFIRPLHWSSSRRRNGTFHQKGHVPPRTFFFCLYARDEKSDKRKKENYVTRDESVTFIFSSLEDFELLLSTLTLIYPFLVSLASFELAVKLPLV